MPLDIIGVSPLHFSGGGNREKMVKKVVDYKLLNGKRYYKVKWKCTWELEDNLLTAQDLVDQFWGFVNRVKAEDDRLIVVPNKHGVDECDSAKSDNNMEKRNNQYVETVSRTSNSPQVGVHQNKSTNDKVEYTKLKIQNFRADNDTVRNLRADNDTVRDFRAENDTLRETVNLKCVEESVTDDNISHHPSMVTINPMRKPMHEPCNGKEAHTAPSLLQHPSSSFKRGFGLVDHNADENLSNPKDIIDLKIKRQHTNGKAVFESEDRRFQCHVCGMAFKRKDMCRRHLRTHSKDFCYFCAICKKGFIRRYVLVKHLNKDHNTNDQTQIISTKRRRRDDVKQEQPSMVTMATKSEPHDVDSTLSFGAPKYALDISDNLTIDEDHDYDKRTDNTVVVLKMEADDEKPESSANARFYEYAENDDGRSYEYSDKDDSRCYEYLEKDESRCYEYSNKNDYRSYVYSQKDDSMSYENLENDESPENEYSTKNDSKSYEYSTKYESRSHEYSGKSDSRYHEHSDKGHTKSYRYEKKHISAGESCTNMNYRHQTQEASEMDSEIPVVTLECAEPTLDDTTQHNSSEDTAKKRYESQQTERRVNGGACTTGGGGTCRTGGRNNTSYNVPTTNVSFNSHTTFSVRHDNNSSPSGAPKYVMHRADDSSMDNDAGNNIVVVLDPDSDGRKTESNAKFSEYSEKRGDSRTYVYSGKNNSSSYEPANNISTSYESANNISTSYESANDISTSYKSFENDPTRYHDEDIDDGRGDCENIINNPQQTQMQSRTQMHTERKHDCMEAPSSNLDCMEADHNITSIASIASISPLNNKVESPLNNKLENNSSFMQKNCSERSASEEGAYRMVNSSMASFSENGRNACAAYNITFSGREVGANQTCQNN